MFLILLLAKKSLINSSDYFQNREVTLNLLFDEKLIMAA